MSTELVVSESAELAGLFDARVDGGLTQSERELISALVAQNNTIDIAIPDTIEDESLWDALQVCCKVESRVRRVQAVLKMLVGRALILMQARPEMVKSRGFVSLDSLMSDEVKGLPASTGISRSELYNAKKIAERFPTISMTDYREIGFNKMLTLSRVVRESDSNAGEWLEKAKNTSLDGLKEEIYRSNNGIEDGALDLDSLMITLNKAEKKQLKEFLDKPEYQAFCNTTLPAPMLLRCIQEATLEWDLQIRDQEESR